MKKVLLDSDAYTFFTAGDKDMLREIESADKVYFSVIVLGELLAAFKKGKKENENLKILNRFMTKMTVEIMNVSQETAKIYADIKRLLEKSGKPIPINDIWIAANVMETGSKLLTFDKHFFNIEGLRIWEKLII